MQSHTCLLQRTNHASWRLGRTLYGSKVHHALIVGRSLILGQQLLRQGHKLVLALRRVDGRMDTIMARQHPVHIAIHHSSWQSEGYRANGCSGIVAHSFQAFYALQCLWEATHLHHLPGCFVQISGPAVIAQALPFAQHLIFGGSCQVFHPRPSFHEAFPVGASLFDARLLQDDFRQPDGVCILRLTPGQRPSVLAKPLQYRSGEAHNRCEGTNKKWDCQTTVPFFFVFLTTQCNASGNRQLH